MREAALKVLLLVLSLLIAADTQPQAGDLYGFSKLGDGDCLGPASDVISGRAATGLSHGDCRAACSNYACLGYSYSPCELICKVHGNPAMLPQGTQSWQMISGAGKIYNSSGLCGSSCYQRLPACPAGQLTSGTATVSYGQLLSLKIANVSCPRLQGFSGKLTIQCGAHGIQVLAGTCEQPCLKGLYADGAFQATYPQIYSGDVVAATCPAGVTGSVSLACFNGVVKMVGTSHCGYNCPAGSLRSSSTFIQWGNMVHQESQTIPCPSGYIGSVTLQCLNSQVYQTAGQCLQNCPGKIYQFAFGNKIAEVNATAIMSGQSSMATCGPSSDFTGIVQLNCADGVVSLNQSTDRCMQNCLADQIGSGAKSVVYSSPILHNTVLILPCQNGFHGTLQVRCFDGAVSVLSGVCKADCQAGSVTSNTVTLSYPAMGTGDNVSLHCPSTYYTGDIVALCDDGGVSMILGECGLNCEGGSYRSNGAVVPHGKIISGSSENVTCPAPYDEELRFRCYQGDIRVDNYCKKPCLAGRVATSSAFVNYPTLNSSEVGQFQCSPVYSSPLTFSGFVAVQCYDGKVTSSGECYPDCNAGIYRDGITGLAVSYPVIISNQAVVSYCNGDPNFGVVTVSCLKGLPTITSGTCGFPCTPQADYKSVLTLLQPMSLPLVAHRGSYSAACLGELSGSIQFYCSDAVLTAIGGGCGLRCLSAPKVVYGASFVTRTIDHNTSYIEQCRAPYVGNVTVSCWDGNLTAISGCQAGCTANNTVLPNGAVISSPDLKSGELYFGAHCPTNYVGPVVLKCENAVVKVESGTCSAPCARGRFTASTGFQIVYLQDLLSNETVPFSCPPGFSGGGFLRCVNGVVLQDSGTCTANCDAGPVIIKQDPNTGQVLLQMQTTSLLDGQDSGPQQCPEGYSGMVRWACFNSVVKVTQGSCFKDCSPGQVGGASYLSLSQGQVVPLQCPEAGSIVVRCGDGVVSKVSGQCFSNCPAGTVSDAYGVPVLYSNTSHGANTTGTCSLLGIGTVIVGCNNSVATVQRGQACKRNCQPQSITTVDGTVLTAPAGAHQQFQYTTCPTGKWGRLQVFCLDGLTTVVDGGCGRDNCVPGQVYSGQSSMSYAAINNGRQVGPLSCTASQIGSGTITCRNGTAMLEEITAVVAPRLAGQSNADFFNETVDDTFFLCSCCSPPAPAPPASSIAGADGTAVIRWVVGTAAVVVGVAIAAGIWFLTPRTLKPSRVSPEMGNADADKIGIEEAKEATNEPDAQSDPQERPALALQDVEQIRAQMALMNSSVPHEPLALALKEGTASTAAELQMQMPQSPNNNVTFPKSPSRLPMQFSHGPHTASQRSPGSALPQSMTSAQAVKELVKSKRAFADSSGWKHW